MVGLDWHPVEPYETTIDHCGIDGGAADADGDGTGPRHATNSAQNPFVVITNRHRWQDEGDVRHSPDHHTNKKTGHQDGVWDEATSTCVEGAPLEEPLANA